MTGTSQRDLCCLHRYVGVAFCTIPKQSALFVSVFLSQVTTEHIGTVQVPVQRHVRLKTSHGSGRSIVLLSSDHDAAYLFRVFVYFFKPEHTV